GGDEIDDEQQGGDQPRLGDRTCQRHEDQRRAEPGKSACRSGDEGDHADGDRRIEADSCRNEPEQAHPRRTPPVFFVTSATILAATASISWSVRVFSRGWIVTAIATDFLSGSMPLPS